MATRNSQRNTRGNTKANTKGVDGIDFEIDDNTTLTCYDWGENQTAKITLNNAFVIYATIKFAGKNKGYFLSYPSYKNRKGDYVNMAYCFDKALIGAINDSITEFMNGLD